MRQQCRECGTVHNWVAPYCDACGRNFSTDPPRELREKWPYYVCAVMVGLAVAVLQYVLTR